MRTDLLKAWIGGWLLTLLVLGLSIEGTHTMLQVILLPVFLPLMIPLGILPFAIGHDHAGAPLLTAQMYAAMAIWGSGFYGLLLLPLIRYRSRRRARRV
ncbi:MAG TPA: hypothetical protein VF133_16680 [Terriglobales bacterium]